MADLKISELTVLAATPAGDDLLALADTSATATKSIRFDQLKKLTMPARILVWLEGSDFKALDNNTGVITTDTDPVALIEARIADMAADETIIINCDFTVTVTTGTLHIDSGIHLIHRGVLNIVGAVSGVTYGDVTQNIHGKYEFDRIDGDDTAGSIGIEMRNAGRNYFNIGHIRDVETGILFSSVKGSGGVANTNGNEWHITGITSCVNGIHFVGAADFTPAEGQLIFTKISNNTGNGILIDSDADANFLCFYGTIDNVAVGGNAYVNNSTDRGGNLFCAFIDFSTSTFQWRDIIQGRETAANAVRIETPEFRVTDRGDALGAGDFSLTKIGGGFMDFKDLDSDIFDCRIIQQSDGLQFFTGGSGSTLSAMFLNSSQSLRVDGNITLPAGVANDTTGGFIAFRGAADLGERFQSDANNQINMYTTDIERIRYTATNFSLQGTYRFNVNANIVDNVGEMKMHTAGDKIFLDIGTHTSIRESAPDVFAVEIGGEDGFVLQETGTEVNVVCGVQNVLATTATDGFLYLPTMAGTPTGDSSDYTGKLPIVWDSSNSKLYINTATTTWLEIGIGDALTSSGLDQFAATTSLELLGVISDETGSGLLMFATSPTITTSLIMADSADIVINATTGTKIGTATSQKLSFYNAIPIIQPTALTTAETSITFVNENTPDFALASLKLLSDDTGAGFADLNEAQAFVEVVANMQLRVSEIETKLQALGLLA